MNGDRYQGLPGWELVEAGIHDLDAGRRSAAALAVALARTRLRAVGLDVAPAAGRPSHELYELLASESPVEAHSRYNALVRRIASFARAAEHARAG